MLQLYGREKNDHDEDMRRSSSILGQMESFTEKWKWVM